MKYISSFDFDLKNTTAIFKEKNEDLETSTEENALENPEKESKAPCGTSRSRTSISYNQAFMGIQESTI